jgi:tetratricopeptide (TPR) repeat protein
LVSKDELTRHLWPSVHVAEANLTNIIVSLRKALGPESIQTVSKHGYRFTLPVTGEPGVHQISYERFARAKELTKQRSVESTLRAREMYWACLAENPGFAAAWAWLGRCCWFLAKFGPEQGINLDLAEASLRRALAIDPDLPEAHQFYTAIQVETGRSEDAVHRLVKRLELHPGETESFVGLVHALRFQGLLDLSGEAHKRAFELDPTIITSVAHTWFLKGEYQAAIETYGGRAGYYLDAASWAALGETKRAVTLLTERLQGTSLSKRMTALLSSLLAVLEERTEDVHREIKDIDASLDPEIVFYFARHYAKAGMPAEAIEKLREATDAGFVVAPSTLASDPWFQRLHADPDFKSLSHSMDERIRHSSLRPMLVKTIGL